jgi:hypothetical protein
LVFSCLHFRNFLWQTKSILLGIMEVPLRFTINSIRFGNNLIHLKLNFVTILLLLSNFMLTELWYQYYSILQEDAPELLDEYIEDTASRLELPVDYFTQEFL